MKPKTNRDDFTQSIIQKLRARVANRCSNPVCRVPTTGPTSIPLKVNNIGVAAHICAAAPGGPRFDASMTKEQRMSIENAIWLCTNCSTDIDRDPILYSVKKIKEWKEEAEKLAREELGKKLPDKQDAIKMLTAALTGLPTTFLPSAIKNTCIASANALEILDPRFKVEASYERGHTAFGIYAKENVEGKFIVEPEFCHEFSNKFKQLIAHGEPLEIDSSAISAYGSKLLEEIFKHKSSGVFKILPGLRKPAVQKFWLKSKDSDKIFILEDLVGEISLGNESFNFKGNAYNKALEFSYRHAYPDSNTKSVTFTFNVNFNIWNKKSIASIPYFDKIYEFFKKINKGWELNTKFEVEGMDIFSGKSGTFEDQYKLNNLYVSLRFIYLARKVLGFIKNDVLFDSAFDYSQDTHEVLYEYYKVISGQNIYKNENFSSNASCTLIADDDLANIKTLISSDEATSIRFEQQGSPEIELFGTKIVLPRLSHTITLVKPSFNEDPNKIKPGQEVFIEWIPEENCEHVMDLIMT